MIASPFTKKLRRNLCLCLCLLGVLLVATAAAGKEVPYLTGRMMDLAGIIPDETQNRIANKLEQHENKTGSQVVVLTIFSLDGENLEDYSHRVADTWELGRKDVDDGVLLLIAKEERKMRLEVGYGLEGALTDLASRRILDNVITPRFRQGDFGGGVEAGVDAVLSALNGEELPAPSRDRNPNVLVHTLDIGGCMTILLFILVLFFVLVLLSFLSRGSRRSSRGWSSTRGWSGGGGGFRGGGGGFSGGGGGFSGGGGGFGGGGASGGW